MKWLNEAQFGNDTPYCNDDFKRTMHHRTMKQRAQEKMDSQESDNATFMIIGNIHVILSSNNLKNMVILMGKGSIEAI